MFLWLRAPFASLLFACGLVLGLIGAPQVAQARPSGPELEHLRNAIGTVLSRTRVPGAGIALVDRKGVIWAGGVGHGSFRDARPIEADTLFRVASVTKSFVALACAQLHERGALDLNAPVKPLLPPGTLENPWDGDSPVTLGHLLEHTAGFDDMRFNETFGPTTVEQLPLTRVLAVNPRSRTTRWVPGSRFAYSNPGYTVAASLIEGATGQRYEHYIEQEVLRPLGIEDFAFAWRPDLEPRLAVGHVGTHPIDYQAILHRPAGSLMLAPAELAKFVHYWLTRGAVAPRIADPATLERIETAATSGVPPTDVSMGLGNYGDVAHGVRARGHDGGLPGYISSYRYFPELGVGYVVLLNATGTKDAMGPIRALLFEALTADMPLPEPPTVSPPEADLERFVGHYEFANPRHALLGFADRLRLGADVQRRGSGLEFVIAGRRLPLVATGKGRFRLPFEGGTSISFDVPEQGHATLRFHGAFFERQPRWRSLLREYGLQYAVDALIATIWMLMVLLVGFAATREHANGVRAREVLLISLPAAAAVCLVLGQQLALQGDWDNLARPTTVSVGFFGVSIAFAAFSALSLAASGYTVAFRDPSDRIVRTPFKAAAAVASVCAASLTVYGWLNGLVGLRTWAW